MGDPLQQTLWRWELEPPRFLLDYCDPSLRELLNRLKEVGVVVQSRAADSRDCTECGSDCHLVYLDDARGVSRIYAACPRCGPFEVVASELECFDFDTKAFLQTIFLGHRIALEPIDSRGFWRVGRATWTGQSREVWFVRGTDEDVIATATSMLATHRRACLFTPTRHSAQAWARRVPGTVIALEDVLDWADGDMRLDEDVIASRFEDRAEPVETAKPRKKRESRAAAIEALRAELNAHILAAADYAFESRERTGTPQLLPKPTQAELAERIGVSAPTLGRCLADRAAPELRILWEAADDVDEVMKWRKLATRRSG